MYIFLGSFQWLVRCMCWSYNPSCSSMTIKVEFSFSLEKARRTNSFSLMQAQKMKYFLQMISDTIHLCIAFTRKIKSPLWWAWSIYKKMPILKTKHPNCNVHKAEWENNHFLLQQNNSQVSLRNGQCLMFRGKEKKISRVKPIPVPEQC